MLVSTMVCQREKAREEKQPKQTEEEKEAKGGNTKKGDEM